MKLKPESQITLTQESLSTILGAYGIYDFSFKAIDKGIENSSALIVGDHKKYVMRVYAQGKKDEDILFEISFQDYLRELEIPIPKLRKDKNGDELLIVSIDNKRWQVILMDFVEGQNATVSPSQELVSSLATLQAKMHLLGAKFAKDATRPKRYWEDLRDNLASKIEDTMIGSQEVKDLIQRIKSYHYSLSPDLPHGYNHLDLDFDGNVITKDNRVNGIVDFDDLQYSPLVVCLGYSLWSVLHEGGVDAMRYYLRAYETVRPLTTAEYTALPNVVFFRNYVMVVIRLLLQQENHSSKDVADFIYLESIIPRLNFR